MDAMSPVVTEVRHEPGTARQMSGILQEEIARGAGKSRALLTFPVRSQDHWPARTPGDVARGQE